MGSHGRPGWRMLICHKHPVSARLHFLVPQRVGVVLPQPFRPSRYSLNRRCWAICWSILRALCAACSANWGSRNRWSWWPITGSAPVSGEVLPVFLAALDGHDRCRAAIGTHWIEPTQSIGMPWLDRELLRRAYEVQIG